jgi:hypothetical protein
MRNLVAGGLALFAVFAAGSTAVADVRLTLNSGRVTVVAKDATVRQILAEWARVGQTKIINAERIPGGPINLELTDVPEQQALEVLLSAISGYVAAPRTPDTASSSVFDRIIVMPTTVAPPAAAASAPPPPAFTPAPAFAPPVPADDQDDDRPTQPGGAPNRAPVFVFPQPQVPNQQVPTPGVVVSPPQQVPQPFQPTGTGAPSPNVVYPGPVPVTGASTPTGVAVPGMVVPAPQPSTGQPIVVYPGQPTPQTPTPR